MEEKCAEVVNYEITYTVYITYMYCTVFCKINEQKGKYTNRSNKDKKETTHLVCILHPISTLVTFTAVRIVALIESQQLPVFALLT